MIEYNPNVNQMIEMRKQGKSYIEIGEKFGISRQRVHQLLGGRVRKDSVNIEKIKYVGIYELFQNDPSMTYARLTRIMCNTSDETIKERIRRVVQRSEQCTLTINEINNLIAYTGKTFEELFEVRRVTTDE